MKSKFLFIVVFGALTTTAVFGQTVFTWIGAADGTNFDTAGNWNPNGVPGGGDTALWNGAVAGNLLVNCNGQSVSGSAMSGIFLELGPSQAGSVQLYFAGPDISPALALFSIQDLSPASTFIFGDNSTNNILIFMRPSGATHPFFNNSTATCVINPTAEFRAGGGSAYTCDFSGSGNWVVNNYLMPDNGAVASSTVQVDGPGTLFWGQGATNRYQPNSTLGAVNVTGGALVMTSAFPLNDGQMKNTAIQNATSVTYSPAPSSDPTLTNDTWNGVISGIGTLIINGGTLTLGGASTYTGNTILSNGELIVTALEALTNGPLGVTGTISFDGGTLGYSVSNTFDYSPRFDASPDQAYSIDTAGQSVTLATGLSSAGGTLTKLGLGTLTLSGTSSYTGLTTVNAGKLVFQGPKSGAGSITVADGAALGVTATGTQVTPGTLVVGSGTGATLEFNNVNSTTTALIAAGTLSCAGTVTININSGTLAVGQSYPLLAWTTGAAPPVSLVRLNGPCGFLSISGNVLYLNITCSSPPPPLNFTQSGNNLQLSWSGSFKLQAQTNTLTGSNWADYPGGSISPVTITIDPANVSVFFRLVSVP